MPCPEYKVLEQYAQLPPWLEAADLGNYWQLVLGGHHGDEYVQVGVVSSMQANPSEVPEGLLPVIANRLASQRGVRYIGDGRGGGDQARAYYPGNPNGGSHEDRLAASINWLIGRLASDAVIIDRHDNSAGNNYASVGMRTTPAALSVAHILGHTDVQVAGWSRFMDTYPNQITIDESRPPQDETGLYYKEVIAKHQDVAKLELDRLTELYHDLDIGSNLTFNRAVMEVAIANYRTGTLNRELYPILEDLEALGPVPRGEELRLSPAVRESLGLKPHKRYISGGDWCYHNASPPVDGGLFGLPDNRERRLLLGTVHSDDIDQPVEDDSGYLRFMTGD